MVPLPRRMVFGSMLPHPVPPKATERMPDTSDARSMSPAEIAPVVALRTPVKEPTESEPKKAWVDEAYVEEMLVVDALVAVIRGVVMVPSVAMVVVAVCPTANVCAERAVVEALVAMIRGVVIVSVVSKVPEMCVSRLNSKRLVVVFHERTAFGVAVPRKKISDISSVSLVALSVLTVKALDTVPEMLVDAADSVLTVNSSRYPLRQNAPDDPRSKVLF